MFDLVHNFKVIHLQYEDRDIRYEIHVEGLTDLETQRLFDYAWKHIEKTQNRGNK